jgi:hypothetical protein
VFKLALSCSFLAIILSIESKRAKVQFIDFGDTTFVDEGQLRPLAKNYAFTAPYAYPCTFNDEKGRIS